MLKKVTVSMNLFTNNAKIKASINYLHFTVRSLTNRISLTEQQGNATMDKICNLKERF